MKFKVGDRVRIVKNIGEFDTEDEKLQLNKIGTIVSDQAFQGSKYKYSIQFDIKKLNDYEEVDMICADRLRSDSELELVTNGEFDENVKVKMTIKQIEEILGYSIEIIEEEL